MMREMLLNVAQRDYFQARPSSKLLPGKMLSSKILSSKILSSKILSSKILCNFPTLSRSKEADSPAATDQSLRGLFRWLKRRRMQKVIDSHIAAHGGFAFHGQSVEIPAVVDLTLREQIAKGKYEDAEAALIGKYLPSGQPVIELGGCLGLVSSFIASRLDAEVPLLVVEANPGLIAACRHNAGLGGKRAASRVVNAAIVYDGRPHHFLEGGNVHIGSVVAGREGVGATPITPLRLRDLVQELANPQSYTLVCDIEGMELDLFEQDGAALAHCSLAIVELHPNVYAAQGGSLDRMMAAVHAAGFSLVEKLSDVCVFARSE